MAGDAAVSAPPPEDPLAVARAELAPGERLVWADRPDPERARRRAWPRLLFGLAFAAFGLFWTSRAMAAGGLLWLLGLPFVALGGGIALAPWWKPRQARATVYAVTDQRILIMQGWPQRRVRSFGPGDIDVIARSDRPDGSGDLVFREEVRPRRHARSIWQEGPPYHRFRRRRIGFFGIHYVRRVEAAVRALRDGRDPAAAVGG